MNKKLLSLALAFIMLLSLLPAGFAVSAAEVPAAIPGRVLYHTAFSNLLVSDNTLYAVGEEFILSDRLRGKVKNDGVYDVTFYGWEINNVIYQPGDRIPMSEEGLVAEAVWVPAVFVKPSYNGGDSDGSYAKPFSDMDEAYLHMINLSAGSFPYKAVSIYLLENVDWTVDAERVDYNFYVDDTITIVDEYNFNLRGAAVPVLFTATTNSIVLRIVDPLQANRNKVSYFDLNGDFVFDNIALNFDAYNKSPMRFLPRNNLTLGTLFATPTATEATNYMGTKGAMNLFVDTSKQTADDVKINVYGGSFDRLYYGKGSQLSSTITVGTIGHPVIVLSVVGSNTTIRTEDTLVLYNCRQTNLALGSVDSKGNITQSGSVHVYVYADSEILSIRDYGSAATANNPAYLSGYDRRIFFDGYTGTIDWAHLSIVGKENGIDEMILKNGSSVTFTGHAPAFREGGVLSVSEDSELLGVMPVGVTQSEGVDTAHSLDGVVFGLDMAFEGAQWIALYGETLGTSICVKSPYGIRFGFEMNDEAVAAMTGLSVTRRGVLIVPKDVLTGSLVRETAQVLDIEALLPISPDTPDRFTGCLVDNLDPAASEEEWLERWEKVAFVSRGYLLMSDGTVVYTRCIENSVENVWITLENQAAIPDSNDWSDFVGGSVQNETGVVALTSRAYYPDPYTFLTKMETVRKAIGTDLTNNAQIKSELGRLFASCVNIGLLSDYFTQPYATSGSNVFGAKAESGKPIGGGAGYTANLNATYTVTNEDQLKAALDEAVSGDVILVSGDAVIEVTDFMLCGDIVGFTGTKIPYQFKVPAGVTLMGQRGQNGLGGGIIKVTSYVEDMFYMEEGSRMTGLVLMGPDSGRDSSAFADNLSGAIRVVGNNVTIDNCEIAGFYRSLITAEDVTGLNISCNYIHQSLGNDDGVAMLFSEVSAVVDSNIFANLTRIGRVSGGTSSLVFTNNVESANDETTLFAFPSARGHDAAYETAYKGIASLTVTGNTFFSKANLFWFAGTVRGTYTFQNNWLAYPESSYRDSMLVPGGSATQKFGTRVIFQNNLFGITSPVVLSKANGNAADPSDARFGPYSANTGLTVSMPQAAVNPAANVTYSSMKNAPVISDCYYTDNNDAPYDALSSLIANCTGMSNAEIVSAMNTVMSGIGGYSNFLAYQDSVSIVNNGMLFGAYEINGEPLSGGYGYSDIFTTGDYIVRTEDELRAALKVAKAGEVVFIPGDVQIIFGNAKKGTLETLLLPYGVTLASDRGRVKEDGTVSTGALLTSRVLSTQPFITVKFANCRVTGMTIKGPDPGQHLAHHHRAFYSPLLAEAYRSSYYYRLTTITGIAVKADNFECDNVELTGYNTSGISIGATVSGSATRGNKIHNSYIHHCQLQGLGYGVSHGAGYSEVYGNYFNFNRHSIQGTGVAQSGYKAYCNVEFGDSLSAFFDMHGGADRNDGTLIAGEYCEIYNNTFLGTEHPFNLRGFATSHRTFEYNICFKPYDQYKYGSVDGIQQYWFGGANAPYIVNQTVGYNIWDLRGTPTVMYHGYGDNVGGMPGGWSDIIFPAT